MSRADQVAERVDDAIDRLPLIEDRATFFVGLVVVLALLARLVWLGERVAHFDEGRVAYWALHFLESGEFHYRFIVHGPFVQHIDAFLFGLVGANDFSMRLVVAVIGGLLPGAILFYREHLRTDEVVAASLFLAFNPVLLYYSRFYRSTIPVAAFAFVAFGLFVRLYDTRRFRYLHAGFVLVALAFAAKENAAVYVLVWIGASGLLLDQLLFRPRTAETGLEWIMGWWERNVRGRQWRRVGPRYLGHLGLAAFLFFVVFLFFYAPRSPSPEGVDLWRSLGNGEVSPVLNQTWIDVETGYQYWFGGGIEAGTGYDSLLDRWVDFFGHFANVLWQFSRPLVALAVVGFVAERYASTRRRNLVMFTTYWGLVSVLGYPLATDIKAAWVTANALVPLAIPAGVGLAMIYRVGRSSYADRDFASVALVSVLLLLVTWQVGGPIVGNVYTNTTSADSGLVQYAQPHQDIRPTLSDMSDLAAANDGVDVLFYGDRITNPGGNMAPTCLDLANMLPMQWYTAIADVNASCARYSSDLDSALLGPHPPVVVTDPDHADRVRDRLPSYTERLHFIRTTGGRRVFFLDLDRLNATA